MGCGRKRLGWKSGSSTGTGVECSDAEQIRRRIRDELSMIHTIGIDAMDLMVILPVEDWSCIDSPDDMMFSEFDIDEVLAQW